jgi:NADPH-dependent curcumin reductase CurA
MDDMRRELGGWLRDGRLKFREQVFEGLENAPRAIVALLHGETTGKVLVRI